jgi:penicillin amidase
MIRLIFSLLITLALFYLLNFPQGEKLPFAAGEFLNPFAGFWQNNLRSDRIPGRLDIPGLIDSVIVQWDDRRVPHIFARNSHDLYLAQGYLTARDRLWQMEFSIYAAAGRISEVIGPNEDVIRYDRFRRRLGMVYAAENSLKMMLQDTTSRMALNAYCDGVNAWINQLERRDLPVEYKILNYKPEPWTPLKSALLLKYMAWDLTGNSKELLLTRSRTVLGDSLTAELYLHEPLFMNPVIPPGTSWNFKPLQTPPSPKDLFLVSPEILFPLLPDPDNGSNNWVVSGSKTQSGYPILCNDPHLGLSLPSIWYEVQLVSPEVNVYGVSLPGAPTVVIGFNRRIAWGVTNAHTDVFDWYDVQFDPDRWQYFYDGKWVEADKRIERIQVRGGETVVDTIPFTHHGPVVYRKREKTLDKAVPTGMALRWTAHEASNELAAFIKLNRAATYDDFAEALSHYDCPGQNFVFAGSEGDIAIHHQGKFPLRWKYQGRFISDGRDPKYDWQGWIPKDQLPIAKNPARGFLASANQTPTDSTYPYFIYGKYATFERSRRLNERLREMQHITPQDMMALQLDNLNLRAGTALPEMIRILERQDISLAEARDLEVLRSWDLNNTREAIAPLIFEQWWENFHKLLWNDEFPEIGQQFLLPDDDATLNILLNDTNSVFIDIRFTEEIETVGDLLLLAFGATHQELTEQFGSFGEGWKWGKARGTDIDHMAKLPGFGRVNLETDGNHDIVNAIKKSHGPSWRMVVQLGPQPEAWGIYAGGQSGNPGSLFYDEFINDWVRGNFYELLYLDAAVDSHPRLIAKTVLRGRL